MKKFHENKRQRLEKHDYSRPGMYSITINTKSGQCFFGDVVEEVMQRSELGQIAHECWEQIPGHFPYVELDEFIIMPNHVHGILIISQSHVPAEYILRVHQTVSKVIANYKATVSRKIHQLGHGNFQWHRSFYDHIIRDGRDLNRIRQYIRDNPKNWRTDVMRST